MIVNDLTEKITLAASIVGLVVSSVTQQIIYAAVPLTVLSGLVIISPKKSNKNQELIILEKIETFLDGRYEITRGNAENSLKKIYGLIDRQLKENTNSSNEISLINKKIHSFEVALNQINQNEKDIYTQIKIISGVINDQKFSPTTNYEEYQGLKDKISQIISSIENYSIVSSNSQSKPLDIESLEFRINSMSAKASESLQTIEETRLFADQFRDKFFGYSNPSYSLLRNRNDSVRTLYEALNIFQEELYINCPWIKKNAIFFESEEEEKSIYDLMWEKLTLYPNSKIFIIYGYFNDFVVNDNQKIDEHPEFKKHKEKWFDGIAWLQKLVQEFPDRFKLYPSLIGTHAKYLVADDKLAMVGSHNFLTSRAGESHEVGIKTNDLKIIRELKEDFNQSVERCMKMLNINEWSIKYTFPRFSSWVYEICFSSDSNTLITHDYNEIVIIPKFDLEESYRLVGHSEIIFSLSLSEDNLFLLSGGYDKKAYLHDDPLLMNSDEYDYQEQLFDFSQKLDPIHSTAIHPESLFLAFGGNNKYKNEKGKDRTTTIYLTNVASKSIEKIGAHNSRITSLSFSPDGNYLASSGGKNIKLWELGIDENSNTIVNLIDSIDQDSHKIKFTPDSNFLLYASNGAIVFWNISERKIEKTIDFLWDDIRVFDITKNGRLIASTDSSRVVKIWDCWQNEMVAEIEAWNSICLTFSPDGKLLASGHTTAFGDDYAGQSIISIWQVPERYYS